MSRHLPETIHSTYEMTPDQRLCLHRLKAFGFPLGLLLMKARFRALAQQAESFTDADGNSRVVGEIGYSQINAMHPGDRP